MSSFFIRCAVCIAAFFASCAQVQAAVYSYSLPANSVELYPDASWLPDTYKPYYPYLWESIQLYTQQSVDRSGLQHTKVWVQTSDRHPPRVTLMGPDKAAMEKFAKAHQAFLSRKHATQGLYGVRKCMKSTDAATGGPCWDPHPDKTYPWAFFLPLGMAIVNQPVVNFMNYPPAVSLEQYDYLNNATMTRWSGVLQSVGIENPVQYETIVDGRPIAAAGTGQSEYLPDINAYFNSRGNEYVTPMISLLAESDDANYSKAVVILGAPAGADWAKVIGAQSVKPGDVGTTTVISKGKKSNWVAGNHPNVTSYQCCPGDPSAKCQASGSYPASFDLIPDEQTDMMVACIEKGLGENPAADVEALKLACQSAWNSNQIPAANQTTLCIRERLDYSWNGIGNCKTTAEAVAFCQRHSDNACATNAQGVPYTCSE